jgi:hypothetical protein
MAREGGGAGRRLRYGRAEGLFRRGEGMRTKMMMAALLGCLALASCGPLLVGGGVIVADQIAEDKEGGDGLF